MHGLVFETSISLLAGSTRYLPSGSFPGNYDTETDSSFEPSDIHGVVVNQKRPSSVNRDRNNLLSSEWRSYTTNALLTAFFRRQYNTLYIKTESTTALD